MSGARAVVFRAGNFRAVELGPDDAPRLQAFVDANPEYSQRVEGGGAAHALYAALESWMRSAGAQWLRLGVVDGNARAERFWRGVGYAEARMRTGVAMGECVNDVRVMVKPLDGGTLSAYLSRVPRDRAEAD